MNRGEGVLSDFLQRAGLPTGPNLCRCIRFEQGWRVLFTPSDDSITATLCVDCPWDLVARAERVLPVVDLRSSPRQPVTVGIHQNTMLLSSRLCDQRCTVLDLEAALTHLLQLGELACG